VAVEGANRLLATLFVLTVGISAVKNAGFVENSFPQLHLGEQGLVIA
jgi:hypothetical protein